MHRQETAAARAPRRQTEPMPPDHHHGQDGHRFDEAEGIGADET